MNGYRTIIVAIGITVIGALQGLDWVHLLPDNPQAVGAVTTGIGIAMAILRLMTSTPVGGAPK